MRLFKPKRAAVLGCGPAGMFSAHALIDAGWEVDIFSNKRRSEMYGVQYLHKPIPGLVERAEKINYDLRGTVQGYKRKVYGDTPVDSVSPEQFRGEQWVWDIRAAYYDAWNLYSGLIQHTPAMDDVEIKEIIGSQKYRNVISTISSKDLCYGGHHFLSRQVWAIGDAPERGIFCPIKPYGRNQVICDGTRDVGWYRVSNVFGYNACEWPGDRKPPLENISEVIKPTGTNCDCWAEYKEFKRVGRYGSWSKGTLTTDAYDAVKELV